MNKKFDFKDHWDLTKSGEKGRCFICGNETFTITLSFTGRNDFVDVFLCEGDCWKKAWDDFAKVYNKVVE